jgi:hypothetical protein
MLGSVIRVWLHPEERQPGVGGKELRTGSIWFPTGCPPKMAPLEPAYHPSAAALVVAQGIPIADVSGPGIAGGLGVFEGHLVAVAECVGDQ